MKNNLRTCNNCKFTDCPKWNDNIMKSNPQSGCSKHKFFNKTIGKI